MEENLVSHTEPEISVATDAPNLVHEAGSPDDESRLLTERQAARYIGMSMSFLAKDRMNGYRYGITHGPEFVRSGRRSIRYRIEDLDDWVLKNRVVRELPK